jgi:hypothetical protein
MYMQHQDTRSSGSGAQHKRGHDLSTIDHDTRLYISPGLAQEECKKQNRGILRGLPALSGTRQTVERYAKQGNIF